MFYPLEDASYLEVSVFLDNSCFQFENIKTSNLYFWQKPLKNTSELVHFDTQLYINIITVYIPKSILDLNFFWIKVKSINKASLKYK